VIGRIRRHRLHELRDLAVDLKPTRCDLLKLVARAREPSGDGDVFLVPIRSTCRLLPDWKN
jgi:hypothetical protein